MCMLTIILPILCRNFELEALCIQNGKGTKNLALIAYLLWIRWVNTNPNSICSERWRLTCTPLLNYFIFYFFKKIKKCSSIFLIQELINHLLLHSKSGRLCTIQSSYHYLGLGKSQKQPKKSVLGPHSLPPPISSPMWPKWYLISMESTNPNWLAMWLTNFPINLPMSYLPHAAHFV